MTEIEKLQEILGIDFHDSACLRQALVHRSYLHENPDFALPSNERLEFLGDSLLGFVIAEKLYREHPGMSEGGMTKLRVVLVRRETLARIAKSSLQLGDCLYLGCGEESSGGRGKQSILAGAFEAVIGAVFLDQGYDVCRGLILRLYEEETLRSEEAGHAADFKSQLQELAQSRYHTIPEYRIVSAEGPDHAKEFIVDVILNGDVIGRGAGKSKRGAEKEAARAALEALSPEN